MPIEIFQAPSWAMNSKTHFPAAKRGMTLIELTTVLVILSLMAAAIVVNLRGPLRRAQLETAIERLANLDDQARLHASRFGRPRQLVIPLDESWIDILDELDDSSRANRTDLGPVQIGRVIVAGRTVDHDEAMIEINSQGGSPTYAVRLDSASGQSEWLLFAGVTGQFTRTTNSREVADAFRQIATTGTDPH